MNRRQAKKLRKKWLRGDHPIRDSWRRVSEARRKAVGRWYPSNARYPIRRFTLSDLKFEIHDSDTSLMQLANIPLIRGPRDQSLANIVEVDDSKFVHNVILASEPKTFTFETYPHLLEVYKNPGPAVVITSWPEMTKHFGELVPRFTPELLGEFFEPGPLCKCGHSCNVHRDLKESGNFIKHGGCQIWKVNGTECKCTSFWPKDEPLPDPLPPSAQIPKDWLK